MKQILVLIFITVLLACHRPKEQEKYFNSLPNNDLINEIIKATIKSDSLLFENGISKKLTNILVCKYELNLNDSIPIPPPPPNGIYLHTLLQLLNSNTSTDQLYNDSIFYFLQSNRASKYIINDSIYLRFNDQSNRIYEFTVPILSFDMKRAYVEYWSNFGPYNRQKYSTILLREGDKWVRVDHWCLRIHS